MSTKQGLAEAPQVVQMLCNLVSNSVKQPNAATAAAVSTIKGPSSPFNHQQLTNHSGSF